MKESYKTMVERLASLQDTMSIYEALHDVGIPYKDVHYYETPAVSSGYSMGEIVVVYCNGKKIETKDCRNYYPKSCRWKAKHGLVILHFTKKEMRRYIELSKRLTHDTTFEERVDIGKEIRQLQKSVLSLSDSRMKKRKGA